MPLVSTFASLSRDGYVGDGGTLNTFSSSYIDTITDSGNEITTIFSNFSSTGNSVVEGQRINGASGYAYVIKCNSSGNITNQKYFTSDIVANFQSVQLRSYFDSSDNIYSIGRNTNYLNRTQGLLVSFDTSLNILWQRQLSDTLNQIKYDTGVLSTSYIYCGGSYGAGGTEAALISSYDYSGTIQFSKTVANCSLVRGMALASSGDYYAVMQEISSITNYGYQLIKFNSSDTFQWNRSMRGATNSNVVSYCAVDSSGNIIVATLIGATIQLVKFNSAGTTLWQKTISPTIDSLLGLQIDNAGSVYVYFSEITSGTKAILMKVAGDGSSIIWQSSFVSPSAVLGFSNFGVNQLNWRQGFLQLTLNYLPRTQTIVVVVPDTGARKGVYTDVTYSAISTYSLASSSLTINNIGNTTSTVSFTDSAGTLITNAGTLTQSVQII